MKTHELAWALEQFAQALRDSPNTDIRNLQETIRESRDRGKRNLETIAVNVATLAALSKIGKREWSEFIDAYKLGIFVRPRDSKHNVLGKILRYFEENPGAQSEIVKQKSGSVSNELIKALNFLLERSD